MRHKTIKKKLLGYLDNELSYQEKQKICNHLGTCSICRQDLKKLKALWQIEQPIERMEIPSFIWARLSVSLQNRDKISFFNKTKNNVVTFLRPAIMIILMLCVLLGGIQLGNFIARQPNLKAMILKDLADNDFGRSYFEVLPPGSIGTRFLAVAGDEVIK